LATLDAVSFLHEDGRDSLAVVEGERHLPQIYITVEHKIACRLAPTSQPPRRASGSNARQHQDHHHCNFEYFAHDRLTIFLDLSRFCPPH
jgi:hypothetical protein